jgi:hypothetical protein
MREILDYLVSSLSEYYEIIEEKLRHFNNIIPGRTDQFTLENARQLVQIVPGISSPELLHCEFQLLKNDIDNCVELSEIIDKLKLVGKGYPNAKKVYKFLLTLPVTVATNERSFSKLKLLKNTLRSPRIMIKWNGLYRVSQKGPTKKKIVYLSRYSIKRDNFFSI